MVFFKVLLGIPLRASLGEWGMPAFLPPSALDLKLPVAEICVPKIVAFNLGKGCGTNRPE